jgi:hypothetical protein
VITNGKHTFRFDESQRGLPFYIAGRWISPTGELGPWSGIIKIIIP